MRKADKPAVRPWNLGRVLRSYRLIGDLEQRALAKRLGISAATVCRLEKGHQPGGETLAKIIAWLCRADNLAARERGEKK